MDKSTNVNQPAKRQPAKRQPVKGATDTSKNIFFLDDEVELEYKGVKYTGKVIDAVNGKYKVNTAIAKQKVWFEQAELTKVEKKTLNVSVIKKGRSQAMAKTTTAKKSSEKGVDASEMEVTTKKKVTGKEEEPTILEDSTAANGKLGYFIVPLSAIVSLDKSGIEGANLALRTINKAHLNSLIGADEKDVPPVHVQNSNKGYLLFDGYHRFTRQVILAKIRFLIEKTGKELAIEDVDCTLPQEKLDAILDAGLSESQLKERDEKFLPEQKIRCIAFNFPSHQMLLDAAFAANLHHGLPASKGSRARYALWLIEKEGVGLREAARRVGMSHVGVIHYRDAKVRNPEKATPMVDEMVDDTLTPEEREQARIDAEERAQLEKVDKARETFVKAMRVLFDSLKEETKDDAAEYLMDGFKDEDSEMVSAMGAILALTSEVLEENAHTVEA